MRSLFKHQLDAISQLKTGSILCGGVGSGKTLTALTYYFKVECGGDIETFLMKKPKDLYVITTAAKRDTLDWEREGINFMLSTYLDSSINKTLFVVDSWNNIKKYENVKDSFFIFDEQRVVGSGAWVKSFLKISKSNNWILLSATPGDTWTDYIPVFIANGFYRNRTEFMRTHVVYNTFVKYPKVDHYVLEEKLERLKNSILVKMDYARPTEVLHVDVFSKFNEKDMNQVLYKRWNPYTNKPIKDVSERCYTLRRVANSDQSRLEAIKNILQKHRKIIVFYTFNYELDILRQLKEDKHITIGEYNGHRHDPLPTSESWAYLVQYISGSEGWNCIETNVIVFFSQSYSYRMTIQAAGRIDRLNTPFTKLYYYHILSNSLIDKEIKKSLEMKKEFNEKKFATTKLPY